MTKLSDILTQTFTDPHPCDSCGAKGPSYPDTGTGRAYCLPCLTEAVEGDMAEQKAERQEIARLACYNRRMAA